MTPISAVLVMDRYSLSHRGLALTCEWCGRVLWDSADEAGDAGTHSVILGDLLEAALDHDCPDPAPPPSDPPPVGTW